MTTSLSTRMSELMSPTVQIGGTTFYIQKMGAMQAWDVFERIRFAAANTAMPKMFSAVSADEDQNSMALFTSILTLEPEFVSWLRQTFFREIDFSNAHTGRQPLLGAEDMALGDLEPVTIYELMLRSLAINFTPSLDAALSQLGRLGLTETTPQPPPSTSPPS